MDSERMSELKALVQLNHELLGCYDQAIEHIDVPAVRDLLRSFRNDHEQHVRALCEWIGQQGVQAPRPARDLMGLLMTGFTAVRSMTGTEGALKSLRRRERVACRRYGEAAGQDWPIEVRGILETHCQDEQRHLKCVEQALAERAWEAWAMR